MRNLIKIVLPLFILAGITNLYFSQTISEKVNDLNLL